MPVFRPREFLFSGDTGTTLEKLKSEGKRAHIIAGGTGFYELARRGYIPEVKSVVSIMRLGFDYINSVDGHARIGATTTLSTLLGSRLGDSKGMEALGDALREIRPVQIRNVATVGGEVCISVPIVDLPIALLACEASIKVINSEKEEYEIGLDDFYIDAFLTRLKDGEIVKEIVIPKKSNYSSAFVKIGRTAYDFNLINAAVSVSLEASSKKINSLRVFIGGIKRTPIRAREFEKTLLGKLPGEKVIFEGSQKILSKSNLLPSIHGSSEYKRELLPVILRDCVMRAYERAVDS